MIAVIPARYGSTRLPAKALAEIERVPMIVRVCRQVSKARAIDRTIVATDDQRIADVVSRAGGEAMLTSPAHQSGTDRIAEVAQKVAYHSVGKRIRPQPRDMVVYYEGRAIAAHTSVTEAGIRPLQHVFVDYA